MPKHFCNIDTHFNPNLFLFLRITLANVRHFDSVAQMNECMFDNWNSVVTPADTVYHLGDVLFGYDKEQWLADNFNKLNGKKHLILGNP